MDTATTRARGDPDRLSLLASDRLLARHLSASVARFGAQALGVIDLPPLADVGEIDAQGLRAAAVLYWASQIDQAGLLQFVEQLADGVVSGRLLLPLPPAAGDVLGEFHRERHDRFSPEERQALYGRLFDRSFAQALDELTDVLAAIGDAGPLTSIEQNVARACVIGRQLAESLSVRAAGMVAFAAREIGLAIRQAATVLSDPAIAAALGGAGAGLWRVIRTAAPAVLGHPVNPDPLLARARAGRDLLAWLADDASALVAGTLRVERTDPAVLAAQEWRAAGAPA